MAINAVMCVEEKDGYELAGEPTERVTSKRRLRTRDINPTSGSARDRKSVKVPTTLRNRWYS